MSTTEPILHVDMTPDPGLPVRILRVYLANCAVELHHQGAQSPQKQRALVLAKAIATLERGGKVAEGMTAARIRGRLLGRPVTNARFIPRVRRLHRQKYKAGQIHKKLRGKVSLPWIYLQIRIINGERAHG